MQEATVKLCHVFLSKFDIALTVHCDKLHNKTNKMHFLHVSCWSYYVIFLSVFLSLHKEQLGSHCTGFHEILNLFI
jgi:hypothetical protein